MATMPPDKGSVSGPSAASCMTAKTVHIDTSLQIEQQKAEAKAKPVRDVLAQYVFTSTSTYARKEFKRAWLQDLNLIYSTARGCQRIEEVYDKIQKSLWHPASKRRLSRCLDAINTFLSRQPGNMSLNALVPRLRAHLAEAILGAYVKWERSVTHEYDGTGCLRAKEKPVRAENGSIDVHVPKCQPNKTTCSIAGFFQNNLVAFASIDSAIAAIGSTASAELQVAAKAIRDATANPSVLCNSVNCAAMADVLIAVDGLGSDHFAANNDKEWITIATALNKPLVNPVR